MDSDLDVVAKARQVSQVAGPSHESNHIPESQWQKMSYEERGEISQARNKRRGNRGAHNQSQYGRGGRSNRGGRNLSGRGRGRG